MWWYSKSLTKNTGIELIKKAQNILVLSGAGMSTDSGVPDFRSRLGIYSFIGVRVMSIKYFMNNPSKFYNFLFTHLYLDGIKPNLGHEIISKWQSVGKVSRVITQNVDGLHQLAGNDDVIEFHGTMYTCHCLYCKKVYTLSEIYNRWNRWKNSTAYLYCTECNAVGNQGLIRPDVVLFGEYGKWLYPEPLSEVKQMVKCADLILVLGSKGVVKPFNTLPRYRKSKVPMVVINKGFSRFSLAKNTYFINAGITSVLPSIEDYRSHLLSE